MVEADGGRAARDGGRLVEGGVVDGEPAARGQVAVGIIGVGGVEHAPADARHAVRARGAGGRIAVAADIGLRQQVADGAVGVGLDQRRRGWVATSSTTHA